MTPTTPTSPDYNDPAAVLAMIQSIEEAAAKLDRQRANLVARYCHLVTGLKVGDPVVDLNGKRGIFEGFLYSGPDAIKFKVRLLLPSGIPGAVVRKNAGAEVWRKPLSAPVTKP